jgi:hypothetical protein
MKNLTLLGAVLLVLGLLAFVVPIPHTENHGVKVGDTKIGVQTEHSDRLPPVVGGGLAVAGFVVLALGWSRPLQAPNVEFSQNLGSASAKRRGEAAHAHIHDPGD